MPDRGRVPVAPLRLRRAARAGAHPDRGRGGGSPPLHVAGRPRDRAPEQASRLRSPGAGSRHRRGERRAGFPRGLARVRVRVPDSLRPRADDHPTPHEQSAQDGGNRVLRVEGRRAGADRSAAQRREQRLSRREAREARAHARAQAAPSGRPARAGGGGGRVNRDIDDSSEDVLSEWRAAEAGEEAEEPASENGDSEAGVWGSAASTQEEVADEEEVAEEADVPEPELPDTGSSEAIAVELSQEHAAGELEIPDGYAVLEGGADGSRRAGSLELVEGPREQGRGHAGVRREAITVMVVPGAFELPLAATALAKTRRFACIVALGCVIRGDTPHFDYVAGESASGLQLAALETGVP